MKSFAMLASILIASIFFAANGYADQKMSAQFRTMAACLSAIQNSSGQKLQVVTDKPHNVSGILSNRKFFACKKMESGTKGTYFEGWYMVD